MTVFGGRGHSFRFLFAAAALAALAVAGCGKGKGTVSGEVRYKGVPLASGQVTLFCQGADKAVFHGDVTDGKYSFGNVPAGPVVFTVATLPPTRPGRMPAGEAVPVLPRGKYVPLPRKYGSPSQSGLSYDVTSGSQAHDLDLR
jgi:hypothetical protein